MYSINMAKSYLTWQRLVFYLDTNLIGFVHKNKALKISNSNVKQFYFTIQEKDKCRRAVCFSPDKHPNITNAAIAKNPINISKMTQSPSSGDQLLGRRSRINATQDVPADYIHSSILNTDSLVEIKSLHEFAAEQVISVKAEICLGPVKIIHLNDNSILKKQETVVYDTTGTITLALFGKSSESVSQNKTYLLHNVNIKRTKSCL